MTVAFSCDNPRVLKSTPHSCGLLLIGAAPSAAPRKQEAALHQAAAAGADNIRVGVSAREALLRALAAFAAAEGVRLSWQTNAGAQGAVSGREGAALLRDAGLAADAFPMGNYSGREVIAGVARDQRGELAAAVIVPEGNSQSPLPPAALAPGAGLCADDWGAAVVLGDDAALWALSPARKLVDALQSHEPASAGRELLHLGRARRMAFAFAALTPAGEFVWGSADGELPRAWAGDGPPPRQARAEKR